MIKRLNLNINPLVSLLTKIIACGKNSTYKSKDIAYRTIQSAIHNQSLEAMFKLTKYLSADRMLNKLHKIPLQNVKELAMKFNRKIKLPKKVVLAIDFTEKEFYGDKNHPEIIGSKGGKYVRRYIELGVVKPALFINAFPVNQLTNDKKELITELLEGFCGCYTKTKINLLLLDRGFFTKEVVKLLKEKNIPFIIPAIRNNAIKKLILKFNNGEIKDKIKYDFGDSNANLLFLKTEKDTFVYITNTKESAFNAHLLYKRRWQIETNFREQNNFIFKTNTNDFCVRYLAFVLGGLLFNAWQLTKIMLDYTLESYLFKRYLVDELLSLWQEISKKDVVKSLDYLLVA
jgi:hypothetical protein